jgi:N6-adenosine-specific RNA methylase IME4
MTSKEIVLAPILGTLTATSWTPPKELTFEGWAACGKALVQVERAIGWWIGDWWRAGQPYGERVDQARESLHVKIDTVRDYAWVAQNVAILNRHIALSFAHHRLVASFKPAEQEEWLDRAEKEQWTLRDMRLALVRNRLTHRHATLARSVSFDQRFKLIYADPPWPFDVASDLGKATTSPELHYPTMTIEEIASLEIDGRHVSDIADDDCALFLWVTVPRLRRAFEVLDAWGFEYSSNAAWDKERVGTGYTFRNQHELLLYAKRGDMPAPLFNPPSMFRHRRGKHSAKPPEVRQALEKMYPAFGKNDRIELFARGKIPG